MLMAWMRTVAGSTREDLFWAPGAILYARQRDPSLLERIEETRVLTADVEQGLATVMTAYLEQAT